MRNECHGCGKRIGRKGAVKLTFTGKNGGRILDREYCKRCAFKVLLTPGNGAVKVE